ncbi:carboxypeptidase-like regulatory domain-containing protein [Gemmata sp. JC717]|uniref:Carboxypeptidase-like regulatory domain-containing protein n=1 Tax=Gemmata algarum TaxID=2975278 RepID=A0ABU5F2K6_9BACT|nr:carboxypeptidase-like regulatory domain-containing protein [Gemmata algarum]MDY3552684.1 carboxypeptidase-like regulatory domain-containing protein [Gemmata algarum]MDY3561368.1 carboxypeptidase-like regulatory domain-containing protein [Gemmata algarum]
MSRRAAAALAGAGFLLLSSGCGPKVVMPGAVKGVVTYHGKPVSGGRITFAPGSAGTELSGMIGPDGSFLVTGLTPGEQHVSVTTAQFKNQTKAPAGIKLAYVAIPEKYAKAESSGLTINVPQGPEPIEYPVNLTD